MKETGNDSVHLVVTSPPYPMIKMWDDAFGKWNPQAGEALEKKDGMEAFEQMHASLDGVWKECARVVMPGGFVCVNIGDATRTLGKTFRLYPNHSRIIQSFTKLGFDTLPVILWRKQTNAPNKFMGSGMLPGGAYVTLEHEYILVFRKGDRRPVPDEDRRKRRESAFFWEERNIWFSDVWDFKGIRQELSLGGSPGGRERSAAYPLELVHRLVNMYSMKGDTVLDPFIGTGTTLAGCLLNERKCIGYEIEENLKQAIDGMIDFFIPTIPDLISQRLKNHIGFIAGYQERKGPAKYKHEGYGFPVVTGQETDIRFDVPDGIHLNGNVLRCEYVPFVMKRGAETNRL